MKPSDLPFSSYIILLTKERYIIMQEIWKKILQDDINILRYFYDNVLLMQVMGKQGKDVYKYAKT